MLKVAEEDKFAIVMKFMHVCPSIDVIKLNVDKKWGLVEIVKINVMDEYHVLIRMKNERDFIHGWAWKGRVMEGNFFRLLKWTKDFDLHKDPPWLSDGFSYQDCCCISIIVTIFKFLQLILVGILD